jgi:hypothetical protein
LDYFAKKGIWPQKIRCNKQRQQWWLGYPEYTSNKKEDTTSKNKNTIEYNHQSPYIYIQPVLMWDLMMVVIWCYMLGLSQKL